MTATKKGFSFQDGNDLHIHFDEKLESCQRAECTRIDGIEKYVNTRLENLDKRVSDITLEADKIDHKQNDWRATMTDIVNTRTSRPEHEQVLERLASLEVTRAVIEGKASTADVAAVMRETNIAKSEANQAKLYAIAGTLIVGALDILLRFAIK